MGLTVMDKLEKYAVKRTGSPVLCIACCIENMHFLELDCALCFQLFTNPRKNNPISLLYNGKRKKLQRFMQKNLINLL